MTIDLDDVKTYCRIDGTEEDALIISFIDAAKGYLDGAGVPEPEADDPRYLLCVKAMVLEFYDHRGMTESVTPSAIHGFENMRTQLKLEAEAERIVRADT